MPVFWNKLQWWSMLFYHQYYLLVILEKPLHPTILSLKLDSRRMSEWNDYVFVLFILNFECSLFKLSDSQSYPVINERKYDQLYCWKRQIINHILWKWWASFITVHIIICTYSIAHSVHLKLQSRLSLKAD